MDWKEWIMQSTATYWVQVCISIFAVIISLSALIISRRTHRATVQAILWPKSIGFTRDNSECLFVKLHNSGPGRAYDVQISAYIMTDFRDKRYFVKGLWVQSNRVFGGGKSLVPYIQPNEEEIFMFNELNIFKFNYHRPIKISYKLGNNKRLYSYWQYLMGESEKKNYVKLSKYSALVYILFGRFFVDRISKGET